MEYIRVAKVEDVTILHHEQPRVGTLYLTPHHLIFRIDPEAESSSQSACRTPPPQTKPVKRPREIWITYPIFMTERECRDVFESIKALAIVKGVENLYAYSYAPGSIEKKFNGWKIYDPRKEYERMGIATERCKGWRISKINKNYAFSPTYHALLVVPATISDTTLSHAKNYRSSYIHPLNNCSITRCSQPLTGVRGNRRIQDEKLIAAIFTSSQPQNLPQTPGQLETSNTSPSNSYTNFGDLSLDSDACTTSFPPEATEAPPKVYGAQQNNLIVDARPTVNPYSMQALGMGSKNVGNYRHLSPPGCTKTCLGIENIHVTRDCLNKVIEAIKDSDLSLLPPNREMLFRSEWTKHIGTMLDGAVVIVRQMALEHSHVLIHCSDGWDRTSQLSSLSQICLDPYFRTIGGFRALVEKDWVSFGHRFRDRCGFLGSDKWFIEKIANAGGGLSEALEKGFGQAKLFFNTGVVPGRASSLASNSTELLDGAEDCPASSSLDRKAKLSNTVTTPATIAKPKEVSPVFHQFLDATSQILHQNPTRFEYNERFLRRLLYHLYSCQYGTFFHNNDKERHGAQILEHSRGVWDYFIARREMWINEKYDPVADGADREREIGGGRVLFPKTGAAIRWWEC
ncbi:protein phosphatase [Tuber brumale]|nr:protein phosphatase [Tuber brumale]